MHNLGLTVGGMMVLIKMFDLTMVKHSLTYFSNTIFLVSEDEPAVSL